METLNIPIKITASALKEFRSLAEKDNADNSKGLRIGVKGGGCAGFSYVLEFDEKTDSDNVYDIEGLTVYVDLAHELYLSGMEIDYQSGLNNRGFIFNNPNAETTCGCGSSFG